MNFLAHLWLAEHSGTSLPGAVLGDLVRGADLSAYPPEIELGIRLHRRIDGATDRHPLVVTLRAASAPGTRRYSGILLDLLFDHVLALDWPRYSREPLPVFSRRCAQALADAGDWFERAGGRRPSVEGFEGLLLSYAGAEGIDRALARIASRMSRPEALIHAGLHWRASLDGLRPVLPDLLDDLRDIAQAMAADYPQRRPAA